MEFRTDIEPEDPTVTCAEPGVYCPNLGAVESYYQLIDDLAISFRLKSRKEKCALAGTCTLYLQSIPESGQMELGI